MDRKLSRKRLYKALSVITLVYIILQVLIVTSGDIDLSRKFWLEHKNVKSLENCKPARSEYTSVVKLISDQHFWILRAAIIASIILAVYYRKRNRKRYILFRSIFVSAILILLIISGLLTWILKISIGKPRPYSGLSEYMPLSLSTKYHSFPSGHTTETFSYIIPVIYFFRKYYIALLLSIYGIALTFTRVILAYHFMTDVLFGIYITSVAGLLICYCVEERYGDV